MPQVLNTGNIWAKANVIEDYIRWWQQRAFQCSDFNSVHPAYLLLLLCFVPMIRSKRYTARGKIGSTWFIAYFSGKRKVAEIGCNSHSMIK